MTVVESDFSSSNDRASSLFDWKFPDPPHTRVFRLQAVHWLICHQVGMRTRAAPGAPWIRRQREIEAVSSE
jgi:hypothetical protein